MMDLTFGEVSEIPDIQSSATNSSLVIEFDLNDQSDSQSPEEALELLRRAKRATDDDTPGIEAELFFGLEERRTRSPPKAGRRATSSPRHSNTQSLEASRVKDPLVFISYQWDSQGEVKKLRDRLGAKGYGCWMDVGQVGAGDQLYEEIDKGIRGCRVFLSCVTERYAQSRNCKREVTLANLYQKPIIPILMEKVDWPPAGSLAFVFADLLYVEMTCGIDMNFDRLATQVKKHVDSVEE